MVFNQRLSIPLLMFILRSFMTVTRENTVNYNRAILYDTPDINCVFIIVRRDDW